MQFVKPKRFVDRVFIHCSASSTTRHDDIAVIRKWHTDKGWSDVGYQGFIQRNGNFQPGRTAGKQPAAQKGNNKGTLAICLHGLYIADFTDAQFETLLQYCRQVNKAYDGKITFHGHCEVSTKTCPVFDYKKVLNLNDEGRMIMPATNIRIIETINGMQILAKVTPSRPQGAAYNLEDAFVIAEGGLIPLGAGLAMENQIIEIERPNILFTYVPTADVIENYQSVLLQTIEPIE